MPELSVEVLGGRLAEEHLAALGEQALHVVEGHIMDEAATAFGASQQQVPVRFGALRGSGRIHAPERSGDEVSVDLTYGGAAAPYALYVHENLNAQHASPTKAKYLEDPVNEVMQGTAERLAAALEARWEAIRG